MIGVRMWFSGGTAGKRVGMIRTSEPSVKYRLAARAFALLLLPWLGSTASAGLLAAVPVETKRIDVVLRAPERPVLRLAACPYAAPPRPLRRSRRSSTPAIAPPKIVNVVPRAAARASSEPASETAAPPVATDEEGAAGDPLLWRVRSPTATVYLFGSLPVADRSLFPLDRRVEDAFHSSQTVVFRNEISAPARAQFQRLLQTYGTYPAGQSLDQHVDAGLMARLGTLLERHGLARGPILRMRPWYAVLTLTMAAYRSGGFSDEHVIEEHFRRQALRKTIDHIETCAQQADALRYMPAAAQAAALLEVIERFDQLAPELARTIDDWKSGQFELLESAAPDPMHKAAPEFYSSMTRSRNHAIAATVEHYLAKNQTTFVVVATSHLIGEAGVLAILAGHGLAAERL